MRIPRRLSRSVAVLLLAALPGSSLPRRQSVTLLFTVVEYRAARRYQHPPFWTSIFGTSSFGSLFLP